MSYASAAGAVIGAGGAIVAGVFQKRAADKAAREQKRAIEQQNKILQQNLSPEALNRVAQTFDETRAKSRLELQKEVDPEIAALREFSKNKLLEIAQRPEESLQSNRVARQLFEENINPDEKMQKLKDTILSRAQEDFDAGASLPPEFQAEVVRTGLNTGAGAGIGVSRNSVGGVTSRLLGGAGLQLKAQRAAEGASLAGTADALARSRQQLLANIFPTVAAKEAAEAQRAAGGLAVAESLIPESGLSGTQATDIEIARRKAMMDLIANRGNVNAAQKTARGQIISSTIGNVTSSLSSALGGGVLGSGSSQSTQAPTAATTGALAGQLTVPTSTYPQMSGLQYRNVANNIFD
jgi:hypothetical protein